MINFRVKNLNQLLIDLTHAGIELIDKPEVFSYGKFAWILDLDGNKIELWEPIDSEL